MNTNRKLNLRWIGLGYVLGIILLALALPAGSLAFAQVAEFSNAEDQALAVASDFNQTGITINQANADLEIQSPKVCSPGTHSTCLPGPYSQLVAVPAGAVQVEIDVFWAWDGGPSQIQPNEHSNFFLQVDGSQVASVYCPDPGDELPDLVFCGSAVANVSGANALTLIIQHADTEPGPTPGSHHQRWFVSWVMPTPTPTPTETPVDTPIGPPVDTPTPTPTETPVDTPVAPPVDTPTPTPTETPVDTPVGPPVDTPTATPTDTPIVPLPPLDTPTPTEPPVQQPDPTPTPVQPQPSPTPTPTPTNGTPPPLLPITGNDASGGPSGPSVLANLAVITAGLALVLFGLRRKLLEQ